MARDMLELHQTFEDWLMHALFGNPRDAADAAAGHLGREVWRAARLVRMEANQEGWASLDTDPRARG